ncbi:MAG: hypothetical protein RMM06_00555 [Armatimonadota bacterium]|nr:hypothetical protein [bacterium]MCS7308688.1 hypothetical protein [Armatimonadota bacterium]MDW8104410.1 hypothetical protein [Armatimonadota bacterium]MDW8289183.1 hypothetical protein [Armatimonadota bacterium]
MKNRATKWIDRGGAVWIAVVTLVFLGLPLGLPAASVTALEKVYAAVLIVGVVWMARRAMEGGKRA